MKISTKTGDKGLSGLYNGKRVSKPSVVFELLGDLDEFNSLIGWCKFGPRIETDQETISLIERFQKDIYRMMSMVGFEMKCPDGIVKISDGDVEFLESGIEKLEKKIGNLAKFINPGTSESAARLHVARAVCRRAERGFVRFVEEEKFEKEELANTEPVQRYINRLSDLLYLMACRFEKEISVLD